MPNQAKNEIQVVSEEKRLEEKIICGADSLPPLYQANEKIILALLPRYDHHLRLKTLL